MIGFPLWVLYIKEKGDILATPPFFIYGVQTSVDTNGVGIAVDITQRKTIEGDRTQKQDTCDMGCCHGCAGDRVEPPVIPCGQDGDAGCCAIDRRIAKV